MNFTRESIFISALRGFFKTIGVVLGIGVAFFLLLFGIGAVSDQLNVPDKSQMTVSADANWSRKVLSDTAPVILKINIHGVIGTNDLKEQKMRALLLDSREGILKDRVKGIILHVNTPGGSAPESNAIYDLFKTYKERYKVPIFAYVEGICASGGMYISCAANQIYASEDSVIGSVGVRLGPTFNVSEAMKKVGVASLTLTEGKDKDMLNPFRPWKEGEDDSLKAVMAANYEQFVDVVTSNRKNLNREKLTETYGAQVFISKTAKEHGYIDVIGNYDSALTSLVKASGIKEEQKYQVIEIEPYQSVFKDMVESSSCLLKGKIEHVLPLGPNLTTELSGQILYLYQP